MQPDPTWNTSPSPNDRSQWIDDLRVNSNIALSFAPAPAPQGGVHSDAETASPAHLLRPSVKVDGGDHFGNV